MVGGGKILVKLRDSGLDTDAATGAQFARPCHSTKHACRKFVVQAAMQDTVMPRVSAPALRAHPCTKPKPKLNKTSVQIQAVCLDWMRVGDSGTVVACSLLSEPLDDG